MPLHFSADRNKPEQPRISTLPIDCAQQLLEHGFHVRGTVRSQDKGQYLADLFKKQGYGEDKFEFVIVEDVEAVRPPSGFFLERVLGADARNGDRRPVRLTRRSRGSTPSCTP